VPTDRLRDLLTNCTRGKHRKTVRWPDQMADDDEDASFRIGRPRQLEIVHLVSGLGPGPPEESENGQAGHCTSFAEAVRAEHCAEQKFVHRVHEVGGHTL
jgi:hypothetical protein